MLCQYQVSPSEYKSNFQSGWFGNLTKPNATFLLLLFALWTMISALISYVVLCNFPGQHNCMKIERAACASCVCVCVWLTSPWLSSGPSLLKPNPHPRLQPPVSLRNSPVALKIENPYRMSFDWLRSFGQLHHGIKLPFCRSLMCCTLAVYHWSRNRWGN